MQHITYFYGDFTEAAYQEFINNKIKACQSEPFQYFATLKNRPLTNYETELISRAIGKYHLKFEVINCLLEYIYLTNYRIIIETYFFKVIQSLIKYDIQTASEAIDYFERIYRFKKGYNYNGTRDEDSNFKIKKFDFFYRPPTEQDKDFDTETKNNLLNLSEEEEKD